MQQKSNSLPFEVPKDPKEYAAAAARLLQAYLLHRGHFNYSCSLECELDEAIAGHALYTDDEKLDH